MQIVGLSPEKLCARISSFLNPCERMQLLSFRPVLTPLSRRRFIGTANAPATGSHCRLSIRSWKREQDFSSARERTAPTVQPTPRALLPTAEPWNAHGQPVWIRNSFFYKTIRTVFFKRIGDLFVTGPTQTHVMDLRILLVA